MTEHFYLCIHATNQGNSGASQFLRFTDLWEADAHIRHWLENACGLDCYRDETERAQLCAQHGGSLPELSFACPQIQKPLDLEAYNGFYDFASCGTISLFIMVLHDAASARKFRAETTRNYELDKTFSEAADEMIEHLELLERGFAQAVDDTQAVAAVCGLLEQDGLPLF